MATIEITIRDESGNIMSQDTKKCYHLDVGGQSFHEIEGAVERLRHELLTDVTRELLTRAQQTFIDKKKRV